MSATRIAATVSFAALALLGLCRCRTRAKRTGDWP